MSIHPPQISFVIATRNRSSVLRNTLAQLHCCGLDRSDYEVIVVDNASADGTTGAARGETDLLIPLRRNAGSCAKAYGAERARGEYVVFLDDDSYPRPGSVVLMLEHFAEDPRLGAAGFAVHLPDGRREGSALPGVFVGCGVGLRAQALRQAGGLDRSFFMQAEEYDLAFRLVARGWRVETFEDLHVEHLKTDHARKSKRTTYHDIRNNLRIVYRYLPPPYYGIYRADWTQRYRWLAELYGHGPAFTRGTRAGRWRGAWERMTHSTRRLGAEALEHFFRWEYISGQMASLATSGIRRVVLADLGKNVFAYYHAAKESGMDILAIGDDRFRAAGRKYRGIPIVSLDDALKLEADAVVVANSSAVHGTYTYSRVLKRCSRPVHHWFHLPPHSERSETGSPALLRSADDMDTGCVFAARQ